MINRARQSHGERGFSLIEIIVVLVLVGVLYGIVAPDLRALKNAGRNGANELQSYLKTARARALASTMAYTLQPVSTTKVVATKGTSCGATQTNEPAFTLTLPSGAVLADTDWSICFGTRGLSDSSYDIPVVSEGKTRIVQVVLGGAVRVQE